jgi:hypothetical protein
MITNSKNKRITYFGLVVITVILGLVSRRIDFVPTITGDMLYGIMVYWFCRFLFFARPFLFSFILALVFCFSIECMQLIQTPYFIQIRSNPILRLVFGQGFLWSDLFGYVAGITPAFLLDKNKCFKMDISRKI